MAGYNLYSYNPSVGAAILFVVIFGVNTLLHTYQFLRTKTWFVIPFIVGGIFECGGYVARTLSAEETPNWTTGPFVIQSLLLLVAPALLAATIYMQLGRIILLVHGEKQSIISRRWLTKLFVAGDILSFFTQAIGAGSLAGRNAAALNRGKIIILIGLLIQVFFFLLFIVTAGVFHLRLRRNPTQVLLNDSTTPWEKHMYALYGCSFLILIRCVFRLIEYAQGSGGSLMSHEVFLYIFDSVLMGSTMFILAIIHPSEINALLRGNGSKSVKNIISVYRMA